MIDSVFWIKVTRPTMDIVGVLLGSLTLVAVLALASLTLGVLVSAGLIARRRRRPPAPPSFLELSARPE